MACIDFPNSPSVNDEFTSGNTTWRWNGVAWLKLATPSGVLLTQKTGVTLLDTGWTLNAGLYEYDHSDVDILSTTIVDVIPDNADYLIVTAAELLPATVSSSGSVKIFAVNAPTNDIGVTLNLFEP